MKYFVITLLLLSLLTPAFAELDDTDLNKIRLLIVESEIRTKAEIQSVKDELKTDISKIKEDVASLKDELKTDISKIKEDVASLKDELKTDISKIKEAVTSLKSSFDGLGGKMNILTAIVCALIGLIGVVIALPAWQNRKDENALKKQVETLIQDMEMLKQHIL